MCVKCTCTVGSGWVQNKATGTLVATLACKQSRMAFKEHKEIQTFTDLFIRNICTPANVRLGNKVVGEWLPLALFLKTRYVCLTLGNAGID